MILLLCKALPLTRIDIEFHQTIGKGRAVQPLGERMTTDVPTVAHMRFLQETADSLRRIAARLPNELAREILRVAKEIEENASELKKAG